MKIESVDVWTVVVPTLPGRVHSSEMVSVVEWDVVPKQIVRLNTDTELYGLGESGRGQAIEDVRDGARRLLGDDPESVALQDLFRGCADEGDPSRVGTGPAYETFEMAVFDLVGKARGLPVHALLGGAVQDHIKVDYWMGHQTPEDGKRTVERALEEGFSGVKIKCKLEDPMVERLEAILDVAGPQFKVTVDPNERFYSAPQAIALAHQLEPLGNVEVFEDPIPKSDLEGYVQIHEQINQPVAMQLSNGAGVVRAVKAGVVDCVNLAGGLVGFQRNAEVAAAAELRCWHGSGVDLGICETSFVHTIAATPNCTMASDLVGSWTRQDDLILEPLELVDGHVPLPQRPGLGCDLDIDAVSRFATAHERV